MCGDCSHADDCGLGFDMAGQILATSPDLTLNGLGGKWLGGGGGAKEGPQWPVRLRGLGFKVRLFASMETC